MKELKGIFPALLTPFDDNNKINEKSLEKLVKLNIEKGVTGFYVGGSTAEAFLLSDEERKYVYEIVKDAAKGATLIAHVGAISTDKAIMFAEHVKKLKYDVISAIPPFYYDFGFEEIKNHYFNIVNAVDLPMLIYNFPAFSGITFTIEQFGQFLCDDRFIGVKHTSNNFYQLERLKEAYPTKVFYNGFDEMFTSGIISGADGGIGSTYNFMAEKYIQIRKLFAENKISECQEIQKDVNAIIDILRKIGLMDGEKEILNQMGIPFGRARKPFKTVTDEEKELIKNKVLPLIEKDK